MVDALVERRLADADSAAPDPLSPLLLRGLHVAFLRQVLETTLPSGYAGLDASRTWLVYWSLAGLDLIGALDYDGMIDTRRACIRFLASCQSPDGGFGGGPGQAPHALSTFAALAALTILARDGGLGVVDTSRLLDFYTRLRVGDGSFRVTPDGEADTRAVYGVIAGATLAGTAASAETIRRRLWEGSSDFCARAFSHEGGVGGDPGNEAHGGYTYCALAATALLRAAGATASVSIDAHAAVKWLALRQTRWGGYAGRANKVVDACYSFWQAGALVIASDLGGAHAAAALDADALARYVLRAAQDPRGGLRDKPGKSADAYHTCYALGGLALAQHWGGARAADADRVHATHELFNVRPERLQEGRDFWARRAQPP